jgi:hypothetical protein
MSKKNQQLNLRDDLSYSFVGSKKAWMTTRQASNWYSVNDRTVRKWVAKDRLNWTDVGLNASRYLVEVDLLS